MSVSGRAGIICLVLDVVGDLLPYAVGVALSPLPLIAVLLVLGSASPRAAAALFLVGRYGAVTAVALIASVIAELLPEKGDTSFVGAVLRILLGAVLIGWAVHKTVRWAGGRGQEPELPGWMASIQGVTPPRAARLAVILSTVNVKEVAFGVGAGLTIGTGHLGPGGAVAVTLLYAALACVGVIAIVVSYLVAADRVGPALERIRDWLVANNKIVIAGVLLVIGAILAGEGLRAL